jgi:hypothetical protein
MIQRANTHVDDDFVTENQVDGGVQDGDRAPSTNDPKNENGGQPQSKKSKLTSSGQLKAYNSKTRKERFAKSRPTNIPQILRRADWNLYRQPY